MSAAQVYALLASAWRASFGVCRCEPLEFRAEAGRLECVRCHRVVRERAKQEQS